MAFGSVNVPGASSKDLKDVRGIAEEAVEIAVELQNRVGVPGGIATLGGNGKLTVSQMPEIDTYTREEIEDMTGDAVANHNAAGDAHGDIRALVAELAAAVQTVELKYGTSVKENAFTVSFGSLNDVVVTGVWNAEQSRIEF